MKDHETNAGVVLHLEEKNQLQHLWDYVFESQTQEVEQAILNEVQRVAGGDPRLFIHSIELYPQINGILIQIELSMVPSTDAERLAVFFDQLTRRASYV